MRSSLTRGIIAKALVTVATAALLAGCSSNIERFQQAYNNPSDADPVYTASVPKPRKVVKPKYVAPVADEPTFEAAADEIIEETPVKRAAIPLAKPKDYASAYKPAYKQPSLTSKKPKLVPPPEEVVADVDTETQEEFTPAPVKAPFKKAKPKLVEATVLAEEEMAVAKPPKKKIKFNAPKPVAEEDLAEVETPVVKAPKLGAATTHTVVAGETLYSLGRKYGVSPLVISQANSIPKDTGLSIGQKVKIPAGKTAKPVVDDQDVAEAEVPVKPVPTVKKKAPLSLAEEQQADADADAETAIGEVPKKVVAESKPKIKEVDMAAAPVSPAGLNLRWPLKGKIISGFGNKPGGLKNEGINISVPEGTSIRAADTGVVAYAGNELKGYGNLVLIRHPGGYVTAYAHAKELFVKRGDKIERGAVIAKAGQTGSVSSPQLHFEVRKGATALDPTKFLGSATAAN